MSREEYLGKKGKFKKNNPGGGRPKKQQLSDYIPKIEERYQDLVTKACEMRDVKGISELSPNVIELLESWKLCAANIEMIKDRKMGPNEQKLLGMFLARANQSLKDALDAASKEHKVEKEKGKDTKKPTGMY